jgi:hypothetical protein
MGSKIYCIQDNFCFRGINKANTNITPNQYSCEGIDVIAWLRR